MYMYITHTCTLHIYTPTIETTSVGLTQIIITAITIHVHVQYDPIHVVARDTCSSFVSTVTVGNIIGMISYLDLPHRYGDSSR